MAVLIVFYLIIMLVSLVLGVLSLIATYRLYEKAGEEGWKSLIPVYNFFVLSRIITGKYIFGTIYMVVALVYVIFYSIGAALQSVPMILISLLFALPVYVMAGYMYYQMGKVYGKSTGWCVAMIFLSPILIIAMGFDKDTVYCGPLADNQYEQTYY